MNTYNPQKIEKKWQAVWNKENVAKADPNNKEKLYITVAYPYPSGGMHVGHARTYGLPDIYARFKRMQGFNVLFPMAWHVTGTPIIGALQRLQDGEEKQIRVLNKVYKTPMKVLESFETPMDYASYFIKNSYKKNMQSLGFLIDWRREFTTADKKYSRFIQWQYNFLKNKDYVKKGLHPTKYDLKTSNPVTAHDLLEGEGAKMQEYTIVKLKNDDYVFPCATLRPETVFGVTHVMVDPNQTYKVAKVKNEKWILSKEAVEKFSHQDYNVKVSNEVKGKDLIGSFVTNSFTNKKVPVLPANFLDSNTGTGVVMSVPAHAPFDDRQLLDIKEEGLKKYGVDDKVLQDIKPIKVVTSKHENPARTLNKKLKITSIKDKEKLEEATNQLYKEEHHNGKMLIHPYKDVEVSKAREQLKQKHTGKEFEKLWDFNETVICRTGGKVIVSLQESWFIQYGQKEWKQKARKVFNQMKIIPKYYEDSFDYTIDWLESWPCIRNFGLGTKLPFDKDFVVEPLSDSTIYMAYYTISHLLKDVKEDQLKPELFTYIFQDEGDINTISKKTKIPKQKITKMKESFNYWYPLDWRTSGEDLVQNHLTFLMFHQSIFFKEKHWPKNIAIWGMGNVEGKKMSSSKGNVILPETAIKQYGADTTRLFLFSSVEPWQSFNWEAKEVQKYQNKINTFYNTVQTNYNQGEERPKNILDKYVETKTQELIKTSTKALEGFETRKAIMKGFFDLTTLINNYLLYVKPRRKTINYLLETQIKLLNPFTPHVCEQLWQDITKKELLANTPYPKHDKKRIHKEAKHGFNIINTIRTDIRELKKLVDFKPKKATIIIADEWKRSFYKDLKKILKERPSFGEAMSKLVQPRKQHAKEVKNTLQQSFKNPGSIPKNIPSTNTERKFLQTVKQSIEKEFNLKLQITEEEQSKNPKSKRAKPLKPAILLK